MKNWLALGNFSDDWEGRIISDADSNKISYSSYKVRPTQLNIKRCKALINYSVAIAWFGLWSGYVQYKVKLNQQTRLTTISRSLEWLTENIPE